jgi:Flp pilus assembly pilin Flp
MLISLLGVECTGDKMIRRPKVTQVKQAIWRCVGPGEAGQTLVEYSLILSLIALIAIPAMLAMSGGVGGLYDQVMKVANAIGSALGAS